jgi:tetratricopeptide (TPR) repeat protein
MRATYGRSILAISPMIAASILLTIVNLRLQQIWKGEAAFGSALNHISEQQFKPAEAELATALSFNPDNAHYHAHQALLRERSLQQRREPFIRGRPELTEIQQAQLRAAVLSYQKVLELNRSDDSAYHNLGWLYWFLRQDQDALACLQKAVALDQAAPLYHFSLGIQRELRDDQSAASAEFATALRLSPGLLDSRFYSDLSASSPQRAKEIVAITIRQLESQMQAGFDPVIAGKLGRFYLELQPARAFELLDRVTQTLPGLSRPWANLGYYFELHGNESLMEECYKKALFLDSSDALSWHRLGKYYDRRNRLQDAARSYDRAVNLFIKSQSIHSDRVRRIYFSRYTMFDDVIPNGLSLYTAPSIEFPATCRRLSEIYQVMGDTAAAQRIAELVKKYSLENDPSKSHWPAKSY